MDLHQFSDWLSSTSFSLAIQGKSWAIPAIQTVHLLALALVFTAGLLLSLRYAGRGVVAQTLPRAAGRYTRLIWQLLIVLLISGLLLIIAEPGRTITNPVFYLKMGLLAAVAVLTLWLGAAARGGTTPGGLHQAAAALTVLLWIGIIFCGRFIAYVESN